MLFIGENNKDVRCCKEFCEEFTNKTQDLQCSLAWFSIKINDLCSQKCAQWQFWRSKTTVLISYPCYPGKLGFQITLYGNAIPSCSCVLWAPHWFPAQSLSRLCPGCMMTVTAHLSPDFWSILPGGPQQALYYKYLLEFCMTPTTIPSPQDTNTPPLKITESQMRSRIWQRKLIEVVEKGPMNNSLEIRVPQPRCQMLTESLWQELTYFPASFTTYAKPKLQYHSPAATQPSLTMGHSLRLFERMWIHCSTSWKEGQSLLEQRVGTVVCEYSKTSAFGLCVVLWFGFVLVGWLFLRCFCCLFFVLLFQPLFQRYFWTEK